MHSRLLCSGSKLGCMILQLLCYVLVSASQVEKLLFYFMNPCREREDFLVLRRDEGKLLDIGFLCWGDVRGSSNLSSCVLMALSKPSETFPFIYALSCLLIPAMIYRGIRQGREFSCRSTCCFQWLIKEAVVSCTSVVARSVLCPGDDWLFLFGRVYSCYALTAFFLFGKVYSCYALETMVFNASKRVYWT